MSKETTITRRAGLALGLSAAALPWLPAEAAPLAYPLAPVEIAPRVWTIYGAPEPITRANGGAIANITVLDTSDGAVLIDAGPSHRYGTALKALAERLTGKPVVRVYLTHIHADHVLGATAFESGTVNNAWNVTWSQSGTTLQASGVDFNRTLAPGATAEFGFCAAG